MSKTLQGQTSIMKLFKIEISKEKLLSIPKEERLFFIQLTNVANELFILQKLTLFSARSEESDELIRRAQNSQALFLIRLTAGILWEGWRLLETHFFGSKLSEKYSKYLSDDGNNKLEYIKKYFSNINLIKTIRDEYAFHRSNESSDRMNEVIEQTDDSEVFSLYFSEHHGNCFYDMSDTLLNHSLFSIIKLKNTEEPMRELLIDIKDVLHNFLCFVGECVLVFGKNHLSLESYEMEIPNQPTIDQITIPYFASKPKN